MEKEIKLEFKNERFYCNLFIQVNKFEIGFVEQDNLTKKDKIDSLSLNDFKQFMGNNIRTIVSDIVIQTLDSYNKYNSHQLEKSSFLIDDSNLLTITDACKILKCSRSTLHRYRLLGLPFIKRGKTVLIQKSDLDNLLKKITLRKN